MKNFAGVWKIPTNDYNYSTKITGLLHKLSTVRLSAAKKVYLHEQREFKFAPHLKLERRKQKVNFQKQF